MSVQSWLNRIWYDGGAPPWWLLPLSLTYGAVAGSRRYLYAKRLRKSIRVSLPVIVVGNLSVGGTGKTPLVCWLVARLTDLKFKPGVVTRGYGGSSGSVRLIDSFDDPSVVGDESILLARRTGAPVAIGRDRPAASQLLVNAGCDVIVSDDGLQHYALARDCEIVVIDGDRRFGNGWLLPAGPLRETPARLAAADAIVVNGGRALLDAGAIFQHAACARYRSSRSSAPGPRAFAVRRHLFRRSASGAHDRERCRKMPADSRAKSLVCAGDREFRRRRIEYPARHRDSGYRKAHRASLRCYG